MNLWIDTLLVFLVLTNLRLLGSSQLATCIRMVALQGILLGLLPLLGFAHELTLRVGLIATVSIALKGVVFPRLLSHALREADVRREVEPFVSYPVSILVGTLTLGLSLWIGSRLPLAKLMVSAFVLPVAFFTMLAGLFVIVSRKKALMQAIGYLVFENGIYLCGIAVAGEAPLLVELGILLDVFVAVFVMGITIFHINREFDDIDTGRLSALKD